MTFRILACLLIASAVGSSLTSKFAPIYISAAAQEAAKDFSSKKIVAIRAQQNLDQVLSQAQASPTPAADPAVAAAQATANAAAAEAKAAASKVLAEPNSQPAPADKVQALEDAVNQIKLQAMNAASSSDRLYMGLTVASLLLALGGSIAGFLRKSMLAGILSLCAGAVGGMPKAFGIDVSRDFYQQLYDGANSLASDMQFEVLITLPDYNGYVGRFKALEAHSAPDAAKSRQAASDLMNELIAAKTPQKN